MMTRPLSLFAAVTVSLGAVACTAILGDFSVGNSASGDGGAGGDGAVGGDGAMGDGATGDDGSTPTDGGSEAAPLKPFTCTLAPPKVSFVFDAIDGGSQVSDSDRVMVYSLGANRGNRLVIPSDRNIYYADFDQNAGTVHLKLFQWASGMNQSWLISSSRYPATSNAPAGTAFLTGTNDAAGVLSVGIILFDDGSSDPGTSFTIIDGTSGALPTMLNEGSVAMSIEVIDPANKDYLLAIEYRTGSNTATLAGGRTRGAVARLKTIDATAGMNGLSVYAIAHNATNAYLAGNPPSSMGPPNGPMPMYKLNASDMSLVSTRQLGPMSGFYQPFAFQTSATNPAVADLAVVSADLNDQNAVPVMHVGQVPIADLDTVDIAKIPGPQLAISQLTFNKGAAGFQMIPSPTGDQYIATSRPINDGTPGVSFLWIDLLGRLRVVNAETTGAMGWPSTVVGTVAGMIDGTPTAVFANVRIAWIEGQGNLSNPPIYSMGGTCLVQ